MFLWIAVIAGWLIVAGFIIPALVDAFMAERAERVDRFPHRLDAGEPVGVAVREGSDR